MGKILTDEALKNKIRVFKDRREAGIRLGNFLRERKYKEPVVLPVPSGGVPVGVEIAKILRAPLYPLIVRKVQLPWSTEAGFGAVNADGDVVLNEELIERLRLSEKDREEQIRKTLKNVKERMRKFLKGEFPSLKGKTAVVVDDGLASGYTLRAGIMYVKRREPERLIVAVPTCSANSAREVSEDVDELICLNMREGYPFAVADAYENWRDVEEEEALEILTSSQ